MSKDKVVDNNNNNKALSSIILMNWLWFNKNYEWSFIDKANLHNTEQDETKPNMEKLSYQSGSFVEDAVSSLYNHSAE